jgi:hypothetical protein
VNTQAYTHTHTHERKSTLVHTHGASVEAVIIKHHLIKLFGNCHTEINERKANRYINKSALTAKIILDTVSFLCVNPFLNVCHNKKSRPFLELHLE